MHFQVYNRALLDSRLAVSAAESAAAGAVRGKKCGGIRVGTRLHVFGSRQNLAQKHLRPSVRYILRRALLDTGRILTASSAALFALGAGDAPSGRAAAAPFQAPQPTPF